MKMKELPKAERPYEKLELFGEKVLSNAELLAIIIKSGTKEETSVQVAQKILKLNNNYGDDSLNFLRDLSLQELMEIKGIGKVKAIQLKAICELAIRMIKPSNYLETKITKQSERLEEENEHLQMWVTFELRLKQYTFATKSFSWCL